MIQQLPTPLMSSLLLMGSGPGNGGGGALSNDTSLSVFTIEAQAAADEGTLNLANSYVGVDVNGLTIVATPTHAGASVGAITLDPATLVEGDNVLEFDVTAEDGVTVQHYNVTLHVLTAGVKEVTEIDLTGLSGASFATEAGGPYFVISDQSARRAVWFNTGTEVQPDASGQGATAYVEVSVTPADATSQLCDALVAAFADAGTDGSVVTVTDETVGPRVDAVDGDTGAVITVTTQGANPS